MENIFYESLREMNKTRQRSFFLKTYGCQMNSRDSEYMASILVGTGFARASVLEEADVVVFNTCCVRESAEDRFFGHLSRMKPLKEKNRELVVVVSGCMSQQEEVKETIEKKHRYVDILLGTGNRHRLPGFLLEVLRQKHDRNLRTEEAASPPVQNVHARECKRFFDISGVDEMPPILAHAKAIRDFTHKAGINIMYGCDNFCSYCIVPYVRGRERSRPSEEIINEVKNLAQDGVKEIMLLGQNVNSYGKGLTGENFPKLLYGLSEIEGLERIRFMTSHPRDFSNELVLAVRDLPKVCKHIHLPLQAGSTRVLADMNRGYTKDEYLGLVAKIKHEIPNIAITTDIIVGYPGESEEDFCETIDVVKKAGFAGAFTFIYSKRRGTPAASREDGVPSQVVAKRFGELTDTLYPLMNEFNRKKIGFEYDCMVDEIDGGSIKGRLDDHSLVHFSHKNDINCCEGAVNGLKRDVHTTGCVVPVRITEAKTFYLIGEHSG